MQNSQTISTCKNCGESFCYVCTKAKDIDFCSVECEKKYKEENENENI